MAKNLLTAAVELFFCRSTTFGNLFFFYYYEKTK